jgi:hypothetical protein
VPVKTVYHLSTESVGTIVGWLIEEVSQFKNRPEDYVDTTYTEEVLRKLSKEMGFSYDSIVEALTESESEVVSDIR